MTQHGILVLSCKFGCYLNPVNSSVISQQGVPVSLLSVEKIIQILESHCCHTTPLVVPARLLSRMVNLLSPPHGTCSICMRRYILISLGISPSLESLAAPLFDSQRSGFCL